MLDREAGGQAGRATARWEATYRGTLHHGIDLKAVGLRGFQSLLAFLLATATHDCVDGVMPDLATFDSHRRRIC